MHPSLSLTIIDNDSSIGGFWSRSSVYRRPVLNQPTPHLEYSDLTMSEVHGGIEEYSDISGDMVTKYLEKYADKFDLLSRCKFNTQA